MWICTNPDPDIQILNSYLNHIENMIQVKRCQKFVLLNAKI